MYGGVGWWTWCSGKSRVDPMKRRWRLLVYLALLLVAVMSLLHPAVHWRLIGWARGESFCLGRPSSYWLRELRKEWQVLSDSYGVDAPDPKPAWAPEFLRPLWGSQIPGLE